MECPCREWGWRLGVGGWGGWGGGWGGWGGWVGPVFWPFLLGDLFSYALWPDNYDYPFWSYGTALDYDYGPYLPAYGLLQRLIYRCATGGGNNRYAARADQIPPDVTQIPPDVTQSCGGFAPGVTSFPIDLIRQAIDPTGDQVTFLDDLAAASSKASAILSASCPSEPPLTPIARLDAVERRLEATKQAIEIVRPPLVSLYGSLSDQQKQRLDAMGAKEARYGSGTARQRLLGSRLARLAVRRPGRQLHQAAIKTHSGNRQADGAAGERFRGPRAGARKPPMSCARPARGNRRSHSWRGSMT